MILTGKAKEDFIQWDNDIHGLIDTGRHSIPILFDDLNPRLQYTLIIDWLDSVGYHIEIGVYPNECIGGIVNYSYSIFGIIGVDGSLYISRHEAIKQSIIKANEIYNKGA